MRRAALLAAIVAAFSAPAGAALAVEGEPIRIGSFLAVTGPAAFLGEPEKRTLELYAERLNQTGGVLGRPGRAGGGRRSPRLSRCRRCRRR